MSQPLIHSTALVSDGARLGTRVRVGPYCVIGDEVVIGDGTSVGPHAVIEGPTVIGKHNRIAGQSSIGTDPQDLKYAGERTELLIGDGNTIREFVTINRGTGGGLGRTVIGSGNLLMTGVHVAHDCVVGDRTILANAATLAGHVEVGHDSTVGAFSGVHQFCRVGPHAFVGGYSVLTRDALPFVKTVGARNQATIFGINTVGLQRKGFSADRIEKLRAAYRWLFQKGLRVPEASRRIRREGLDTEDVRVLLDFVAGSQRGFVR